MEWSQIIHNGPLIQLPPQEIINPLNLSLIVVYKYACSALCMCATRQMQIIPSSNYLV